MPIISNMSPPFWAWACRFECDPIVSNTRPSFRTNVSPSFQVWARHFEREPVVSNVSLSFRMSARRFECQPIILSVSPSFRTWACCFELQPVVSNVSPSFRMSAHRFKREPVISNVTHGWHSLWLWMQPSHGVQATSTVGTMYSAFVYKGTCNYIIYYYYVQDRSGTGRKLVWTVTGSDRSCNRKKPRETAVDRSMTVLVLVFENLRNGGPVSVPVFSNMDEKPDWTGLPSTTTRYLEFVNSALIFTSFFLWGALLYIPENIFLKELHFLLCHCLGSSCFARSRPPFRNTTKT